MKEKIRVYYINDSQFVMGEYIEVSMLGIDRLGNKGESELNLERSAKGKECDWQGVQE